MKNKKGTFRTELFWEQDERCFFLHQSSVLPEMGRDGRNEIKGTSVNMHNK